MMRKPETDSGPFFFSRGFYFRNPTVAIALIDDGVAGNSDCLEAFSEVVNVIVHDLIVIGRVVLAIVKTADNGLLFQSALAQQHHQQPLGSGTIAEHQLAI